MPSLDDLKKRIKSVKSTQKITKAMKMVAAAKLRKAQENAERGRPYSRKMQNIILNLTNSINDPQNAPKFCRCVADERWPGWCVAWYLLAGTECMNECDFK